MSHYDDDRVIALLREAVPPVPDGRDRMVAIRDRAGRQRMMLWSQTLGAVVAVLLVVGVAAAFTTPSGGRIQPTDEPIDALVDALRDESSVRFEASMEPKGGDLDVRGVPADLMRRWMTGHVTGAATRDGDIRVKGRAAYLMGSAYGDPSGGDTDTEMRLVNGRMYRTLGRSEGEDLPPGKKWVEETDPGDPPTFGMLERQLRIAAAILEDVRYVGQDTVRGVAVAEYEAKVPAQYVDGQQLTLRFALDRENRPRRIETTFSFAGMFGMEDGDYEYFGDDEGVATAEALPPGMRPARPSRQSRPGNPLMVEVRAEFFGYGDDVDIDAPPANEVVTVEELYDSEGASGYVDYGDELAECVDQADTHDETRECYEKAGFTSGSAGSPQPEHCDDEDADPAKCPEGRIDIGRPPHPPVTAATPSPTP